MKINFLLTAVISILLLSSQSIFDQVEWDKVFESGQTAVYLQKNKSEKINYYKAEKTVPGKIAEKLYKNILDFENYPKIFPRTAVFKKVRQLNENKFIMYSIINFKPLKNRDYYIVFEFFNHNGNYSVDWSKVPDGLFDTDKSEKGIIRVKDINGRWTIKETGNNTVITAELHNDFQLDLPSKTVLPYEIASAAEMLDDLVKYTLKK